MAGQPPPYTGQNGNKLTSGGTSPAQKAAKAGFKGLALVTIVALDAASGYAFTQSDYNSAWLRTHGGKDFSSYGVSDWPNFSGTSCSNAPAFLAYALPVATANQISIPSQWNSLAGCSQNKNVPGGQLINNLTDALNGALVLRFVEGLFGGILLMIGLMMFVKQLTGTSITGIPGKFGRYLAA